MTLLPIISKVFSRKVEELEGDQRLLGEERLRKRETRQGGRGGVLDRKHVSLMRLLARRGMMLC